MNVQNPMAIDFGSIATQITSDCTIGLPDVEHPSESCHENNYTAETHYENQIRMTIRIKKNCNK